MSNFVLGAIAALLWGGAYGAYFAPELRRWWRRRGRRTVTQPIVAPPQRSMGARYRGMPMPQLALRPPPPAPGAAQPAAAPRPSNVIPFPRRPRG